MFKFRIHSAFLRNWLALSFSDLAGQALSFLAMFRVARHLGPDNYGILTLMTSTASLFALFAILGLSQVIVVEVAKNKHVSPWILRGVLRIRAISIPLTLVLFAVYSVSIKHESISLVLVLTGILIINSSIADILESIAFGRQAMKYTSALNFANNVTWVIGLYVIPLRYLTIEVILLYSVSLQILRTIIYFGLEWRDKFFQNVPGVFIVSKLELLQLSAPYYWMSLVSAATVQVPVLLLGMFSGNAQVGLYTAGYRLVLPMSLVLNGMSRVMFPKLVQVRQASPRDFGESVHTFLSLLVFLGAAIALIVTAMSHELIWLTVGAKYASAAPSFINQLWYLYLYSLLIVIGITLAAMEQQRFLAILATIGAVVSLPFVYAGAHLGAVGLSQLLLLFYVLDLAMHFWSLEWKLQARMGGEALVRNAGTIVGSLALSRLLLTTDTLWLRLVLALAGALLALPLFRFEIATVWRHLIVPRHLAPAKAG
jgi:O-antigen/teichoic acid export membrane protein